tara:strand:- start:2811 stop:3128 length:318 start_codon:yes stop_codon:yes gene_type:complete
MMNGNSLVYKNVKVVQTKHDPFCGYDDDNDGFIIDDEDFETEIVSDDEDGGECIHDYTDSVSECSTQCETDETDSDTSVITLFKKNTAERNLPDTLKLETDFIED